MSHHGVYAGGQVICAGGAVGEVLWWLVFLLWRIKVLQLLFVCDGVVFSEDAVSFFCFLCYGSGGWGGSSSAALEDLSALAIEEEGVHPSSLLRKGRSSSTIAMI